MTNLLVVNCRFENNEATNGGAVALRIGHQANQVNVDFVNCEFYDNSSDGDGGAVWNCGGTVRLTNCVVARNNCDDDGAGVFLANPNARFFPGSVSRGDLLNCTITKNEAVSDGGGVFFDNNSQFIAKNSIFWGNKDTITQDGAATDEEAQISHGSSPNYDIDYCCIRLLSSFGGTGNISTNPMFIDASTDNYRLDVGSSCADKGSNADIPLDVADLDGDAISMEPTPYDLDRLTRRSKDGAISLICEPNFVDMGAYETHDCDGDGVPDAEETDGNADGVPDDCQDCNGNSIPDWVELAECAVSETGCKDCNGNGVLDECDIDMGCSADDNDDGRPDDCGCGLDIVIIVDNSGSMGGTNEPTPSGCENEFDNICNMVSGLSSTLQAANLPSLRITVLDISPTKESLPCADDNVVNLTGVYDEASNTCSGTIQDSAESWVSAVEIIVMNFDWNPGAKRIIVPISDEGPCHGDSPPICGTSDDDSVDAAIAAAIDNDCIVYSILGVTCQTAPNWLGCVPAYYEDIALSTGGAYFEVGGAGLQANYENIVGPDLASLLMDRIQSCLCAGDCVTSTTFAPPPDGEVNAADLAYLLGSWGSCPGCCSDTVSSATFTPPPDGVVDAADLAMLLGNWGSCGGESFMSMSMGSPSPNSMADAVAILNQLLLTDDPEAIASLIQDLLTLLAE